MVVVLEQRHSVRRHAQSWLFFFQPGEWNAESRPIRHLLASANPPSVPSGTYQDAGFAWGGNGKIQWGESVVTFNKVPDGSTTTFVSTFYNSTYNPPSSPAVAAKVAAIGSNMAQVATGDSGGGVFSNSGSGWILSGLLVGLDDIGTDRQSSNPPTNAAYGDLTFAIDLSQYATSIQNIINSTATWTGQTGPGSTSTSWDSSTLNWSNAANEGATSL